MPSGDEANGWGHREQGDGRADSHENEELQREPNGKLFVAVAVAEDQPIDADGDRSCSGCKQSADDVMSQAAGLIHVA